MKEKMIESVIHGMLHVARPLEITRVRHLLSDGSLDEVITEIVKYQNEDGGFGHGLEPDFWNPYSSATQTCVAINILREHQVDSMHPVVEKVIDYLTESFDDKIMRWHAIHPDNLDYPHAPWWENEGPITSFNPSASLAGFIISYGNPMLPIYAKAKKVCDEAILLINNMNETIERHELRCLIEMMNDISFVYQKNASYIKAKNNMILRIDETIEKDETLWFTRYSNKPSTLIKSHPSLGSEAFFDLLLKEIDQAFEHQNEENLWDITWAWGSNSEAYQKAKKDWQGIIAFDYLKLVKDLGILIEV